MKDNIFTPQELMQFQAKLKEFVIGGAKSPFILTIAAIQVLALSIVAYIEWEIVYRVFEFLSGDNNYWSPEIMGLTAAIMILGFHLQAANNPNSFAVRFVNRAVQFLIPIYMIGVGLLIASILDVGSLIEDHTSLTIGEIPKIGDDGWIETFFSSVADPAAALVFSLGLGGLAIVNIYVAHNLLKMILSNLNDVTGRLSQARQAIADYNIILRCQKQYSKLFRELGELELWDDLYIRLYVAGEALSIIDNALLPHRQELIAQDIDTQPEPQFGEAPKAKPNLKAINSAIKKIEAINQDDILKHIEPKILEKK